MLRVLAEGKNDRRYVELFKKVNTGSLTADQCCSQNNRPVRKPNEKGVRKSYSFSVKFFTAPLEMVFLERRGGMGRMLLTANGPITYSLMTKFSLRTERKKSEMLQELKARNKELSLKIKTTKIKVMQSAGIPASPCRHIHLETDSYVS